MSKRKELINEMFLSSIPDVKPLMEEIMKTLNGREESKQILATAMILLALADRHQVTEVEACNMAYNLIYSGENGNMADVFKEILYGEQQNNG